MTSSVHRQVPSHYAGDKGFGDQPPARLARLLLAYGALAADRAVPGTLRDYAIATLPDLRARLAKAVTA